MTIKHHLIGAAIAVATISSSCAGHDHEKDHDHEHGHNQPEQTDRHEHGTDDIVLDHHTAERFGVRTETVTPGDFTEVIRVTGQVIRSASSAGSDKRLPQALDTTDRTNPSHHRAFAKTD